MVMEASIAFEENMIMVVVKEGVDNTRFCLNDCRTPWSGRSSVLKLERICCVPRMDLWISGAPEKKPRRIHSIPSFYNVLYEKCNHCLLNDSIVHLLFCQKFFHIASVGVIYDKYFFLLVLGGV